MIDVRIQVVATAARAPCARSAPERAAAAGAACLVTGATVAAIAGSHSPAARPVPRRLSATLTDFFAGEGPTARTDDAPRAAQHAFAHGNAWFTGAIIDRCI